VDVMITFREGLGVGDCVIKALLLLGYHKTQETATARDYFPSLVSLNIQHTEGNARKCRQTIIKLVGRSVQRCHVMSCNVGLFYDEPLLIKFIVSSLEAVVAGVRCGGSTCLVRLRRGTKIYRRFGKLEVAIFEMNESGGHWGY